MRAILFIVGALLVGCQPEIGPGTYYCGPERFCPPNLACDDSSFTCINAIAVAPFECPAMSQDAEPDDSQATAADLGALACGTVVTNSEGCVADADQADYYRFENAVACTGTNPHLELKLRFPVATVALVLEILDEAGQVVATGEPCTPEPNFSGRDHLCLEMAPDQAIYYIRVRVADDAPDCDGDCRHNQYLLDVVYPLA
ncbi:MAG TPA: hypothetical protein VML75_10760 [Kofleriaceae bacterium]|nr:hypothetical protein [Kofleriaceae bacterium]